MLPKLKLPVIWPIKRLADEYRGSLRLQLTLWNVGGITFFLAVLGFVCHFFVYGYMVKMVDQELEHRVAMFQRNNGFRLHLFDHLTDRPGDRRNERGARGRNGQRRDEPPPRDGVPEENPPSPDMSGDPPLPNRPFGFGWSPFGWGGSGGWDGRHPHDRPDARDGRSGGRGGNREMKGFSTEDDPYRPRLFFSLVKAEMEATATRPWDFDAIEKVQQHPQTITSMVTVNGEDLRVLTSFGYSMRDEPGVVQAPYPLKEVYRAMTGIDMVLLCLIPVGLVGAWWMGAAMTSRVLRPVHQMTRSAGIIGAEDLSQRLEASGNDEFAELAATFNGLLGRLDIAFQEQREILQQQQRFTADASHELKTPLTIIKGRASLALARGTTDERSRKAFQEIDDAANSMSRLVQDLLLLARSDEGRLGQNRVPLAVTGLLEMAVARSAKPDGAEIKVDVEPEDLEIVGNEEELIRLFRNLLDNAVHYTPADGSIRISARRVSAFEGAAPGRSGERFIEISIADTGQGIAPEHLAHLGERFYRVDSSRTRPTGGTGLGLSICRGIANAHSAKMTFESWLGRGTTVRISFPVDC